MSFLCFSFVCFICITLNISTVCVIFQFGGGSVGMTATQQEITVQDHCNQATHCLILAVGTICSRLCGTKSGYIFQMTPLERCFCRLKPIFWTTSDVWCYMWPRVCRCGRCLEMWVWFPVPHLPPPLPAFSGWTPELIYWSERKEKGNKCRIDSSCTTADGKQSSQRRFFFFYSLILSSPADVTVL